MGIESLKKEQFGKEKIPINGNIKNIIQTRFLKKKQNFKQKMLIIKKEEYI